MILLSWLIVNAPAKKGISPSLIWPPRRRQQRQKGARLMILPQTAL
jgi:hypothetical protein